MKWIKGFLIVGMMMLAHSTVSINNVEAKAKTEQTGKKGKTAKEAKTKTAKKTGKKAKAKQAANTKKGGLFSAFTSGLKKVGGKLKAGAKAAGSKIVAGAKAAKDNAGNAVACRSGKGEVPGQKLYAMATAGTQLTDAHVVAAHAKAAPKNGRKK